MAGFFSKLVNAGAAYLQHVQAVRKTLNMSEEDAAASLSSYVTSLSNASFVGFKMSIAQWVNTEKDKQIKHRLDWVVANADALRQQQPITAIGETRQDDVDAPRLLEGEFTYDEAVAVIDPWFNLSMEQCEAELFAALAEMSDGRRESFIGHLDAMHKRGRAQIEEFKRNEDKSWGSYREDRINYQMAKLATGASDPTFLKQLEQQETMAAWLKWIWTAARKWQPQPAYESIPVAADSGVGPADGFDVAEFMQNFTSNREEQAFDQMQVFFDAEIKKGRISPDRKVAWQGIFDRIRETVAQCKSGVLSPVEAKDRYKQLFGEAMPLMNTPGHHLVAENPSTSARAKALLPYLEDIKAFANSRMMLGVLNSEGEKTLEAKAHLSTRISAAVTELSSLQGDAAVIAFERTELRSAGLRARQLALLAHLTVAHPFWDHPEIFVEANLVFFGGAPDARRLLTEVCKQKQLEVGDQGSAKTYGQSRWDLLRTSAVAIFDWRGYEIGLASRDADAALELAATAYEQGLALALGIPIVVLAKRRQRLPFDIDIEPVLLSQRNKKENQETLAAALDNALYGLQRSAVESGLLDTAEWLRLSFANHPKRNTFEGMGWFDSKYTKDPVAFQGVVSQLLSEWPVQPSPLAVFPSWRPTYPAVDASAGQRLFHVMPFSESWSDEVADAVSQGCSRAGVTYERGDTSTDERIVRRVWNGICAADFVVVDQTGLNPNVMIELGMAHALGRKVLLLEQTKLQLGIIRNLAKIEVKRYPNAQQLQTLVSKWLSS